MAAKEGLANGARKGAKEHAVGGLKDQPHAHNYPGRKVPGAEKVRNAQHNQAALNSGRGNSLGESANGSHKGLRK